VVESWKPQRRSAFEDIAGKLGSRATLALPALAVIPLFGIAAFTPAPLILPVISLVCLAAAAGAAMFAWRTHAEQQSATITSWDIAGAFAFIGFAAAMLSKPENVVYALAGAVAG
jgi:hypothetical protein